MKIFMFSHYFGYDYPESIKYNLEHHVPHQLLDKQIHIPHTRMQLTLTITVLSIPKSSPY